MDRNELKIIHLYPVLEVQFNGVCYTFRTSDRLFISISLEM